MQEICLNVDILQSLRWSVNFQTHSLTRGFYISQCIYVYN